jgi:hypothetical protein
MVYDAFNNNSGNMRTMNKNNSYEGKKDGSLKN